MDTYKITAHWEGRNGVDSTEIDLQVTDVYRMQTAVEKIAVVGVWDQDEVGRDVLIPPGRITDIVAELVDV